MKLVARVYLRSLCLLSLTIPMFFGCGRTPRLDIAQQDYIQVESFSVDSVKAETENSSSQSGNTGSDDAEAALEADPVVKKGYPVGPGDILSVSVYGRSDMSGKLPVRGDGTIFVPLAGDIEVVGKTAREVQEVLREKLVRYVKDVQVGVYVEEHRSASFSILGAVKQPGRFPWTGPVSVYDALAFAGGLAEGANPGLTSLVRDNKRHEVNLNSVWAAREPLEIKQVVPGDILFVPGADQHHVAVLGRVNNPGLVPFKGSRMYLSQALAQVGGVMRGAKLAEVRVLRILGEGKYELRRIDVDHILDQGVAPSLPGLDLRPGDVIYVPQTAYSSFTEAVRDILPVVQAFTIPLGITTDILILRDLL